MKNRILFILIVVLLFSFCLKNVSASERCSSNGYTVLTVNGIFTNIDGAIYNKDALKFKLHDTYNNQPLTVDYLYNATHLGGAGDLVDVLAQMIIDKNDDYDMVEVLNDASQKITTQKLLLVGHSQGNFYANNLYDAVTSQSGGVPSQSIGVYGVASPASRVAGGGKYVTSDTDSIINSLIVKLINTYVLPPNIHIPLQSGDGNGHDFSGVYLKYQSDRIVSDIKSSLDKLQNNNKQQPQEPCISSPELTALHKVEGVALTSADFVINSTKKAVVYVADVAYNTVAAIGNVIHNTGLAVGNIFKGLSADVVGSLADVNSITTLPPDISGSAKDGPSQETDKTTMAAENSPTSSGQENTINNILQPVASIASGIVFHGGGNSGSVLTPQTENDPLPEEDSSSQTVTDTSTTTDPISPVSDVVPPVVDTTAPVITILGNSSEVVIKDSIYTDTGATALDDVDGDLTSSITKGGTFIDTTTIGTYTITYTVTDLSGKTSTATRTVTVATYKYITKYTFGNNNGDGKDWQIWSFNGSNVYDWSDTYVNNYLREQFKIQAYTGGYWCSQCLQRGIFNHNPQKGFELSDLSISSLENNPQNNSNGLTYDVVLQWNSTGYTYTISHDSIVDATGHTDITDVNENTWVSWDGSFNNFQTFPSGNWQDKVHSSPVDRIGGDSMIISPYPVYITPTVSALSTLSLPNSGPYAADGIDPTRGRTNLTSFNFQTIYTDPNGNSPQNVTLHVADTITGTSISDIIMSQISHGADVLSDGNFTNGELYTANSIYETGNYSYYFTANDNQGRQPRAPENGVLRFTVIPSTYTYLPKYKFGTNNGDGRNWQVWLFNGSNVYDWSDTYVDHYLREQFKIQAYTGGFWCSFCLQRGIFDHDPQKGFELTDVSTSPLENNPQNNSNGLTYDATIQWDSTGYIYTISHDSIVDFTGHTDVADMNNDLWVGWDGSLNNFQTFPSGDWYDSIFHGVSGYTGGGNMILQPYPVYSVTESSITPPVDTPPTLDSSKAITVFNFTALTPNVVGAINEASHTVSLTVPFGTDVKALVPTIIISDKASINPNTNIVQNFTNPVTYTVTAEDNSIQNYIVTVAITTNPNPGPDTIPPSIASYTLNGITGDITINPTKINPLSIVLTASENVNWMTIKIENTNDKSFYKTFQSGAGCVDGTNICTKSWDGTLSSGGLLKNGTYKIRVHIQDAAKNDYEDYLPSVITINTSI